MDDDTDDLLTLSEAEYEASLAQVRDAALVEGQRRQRAETLRLAKAMCHLNGDGAKFVAALAELAGERVTKGRFDPTKHPHGDHGHWANKDEGRTAKKPDLTDEQRELLRQLTDHFPDGIGHLLTKTGHVADEHLADPEEEAQATRIAELRDKITALNDQMEATATAAAKAHTLAAEDDELNDEINDTALANFAQATPLHHYFDTAEDPELELAAEALEDALTALADGPMPEHDDPPHQDAYTIEPEELPDEDDDSDTYDAQEKSLTGLAELASERLEDQHADTAKHATATVQASAEWRAETRANLETLRDAATTALALYDDKYDPADDPDGVRGRMVAARDTAGAMLAKFDLPAKVAKGFDPNEKRDDGGKWSESGGGAGAAEKPTDDPKVKGPNPALPDAARPTLERAEISALKYYSGGGYVGINKFVRGQGDHGDEHYAEQHTALQTAFAKAVPFEKPVTTYRVMQLRNLEDADLATFLASLDRSAKDGSTVSIPGYTSTTTDKAWADRLAEGPDGQDTLVEFVAHKGLDVKPYSQKPEERELLLDHNSQFRVIEHRTEEVKRKFSGPFTRHFIKLEQVSGTEAVKKAVAPTRKTAPTGGKFIDRDVSHWRFDAPTKVAKALHATAHELDDAVILKALFTGTIRDTLGRQIHFVDGKRVAAGDHAGEAKAKAAPAGGFGRTERGPESVPRIAAQSAHGHHRAALAQLKGGKIDVAEAKKRMFAATDRAITAMHTQIKLRIAALRHDFAERHGEDALESPQWQEVERAQTDWRDYAHDRLQDLHDESSAAADHLAKTGTLPPKAKQRMSEWVEDVAKSGQNMLAAVAKHIGAYKAEHGAVQKALHATAHEQLAAAIDYTQACLKDGKDATDGLAALHRHAGGLVQKAWGPEHELLHPRADNGRWIPASAIRAAKKDAKKADKLRKETTDPVQREKLDQVLAGDTHHSLLATPKEVKEKVTADRDTARAIRDKLRTQHQMGQELDPADLRALIPHLSAMTQAELSNVRTMLSGAGASFKGQTLREDRVQALTAWLHQTAIHGDWAKLPPGSLFSRGRREAAKSAEAEPDTAALDAAEGHAERMRNWEADRPGTAAAENARDRAEVMVGAARAGLGEEAETPVIGSRAEYEAGMKPATAPPESPPIAPTPEPAPPPPPAPTPPPEKPGGTAGRLKTAAPHELDALIAAGHREVFRGVPHTGIDPAEDRIGQGDYGAGRYVSTDRHTAERYASGENGTADGTVIRGALAPHAKLADSTALSRQQMDEESAGTLPTGVSLADYATQKGYDGIHVPHKSYINVLNPDVLRVEHGGTAGATTPAKPKTRVDEAADLHTNQMNHNITDKQLTTRARSLADSMTPAERRAFLESTGRANVKGHDRPDDVYHALTAVRTSYHRANEGDYRPEWTLPALAGQVAAGELTREQAQADLVKAFTDSMSATGWGALTTHARELGVPFKENDRYSDSKKQKLAEKVAAALAPQLDAAHPYTPDAPAAPREKFVYTPPPEAEGAARPAKSPKAPTRRNVDVKAVAAKLKDIQARADNLSIPGGDFRKEAESAVEGLSAADLNRIWKDHMGGVGTLASKHAAEKVVSSILAARSAYDRAQV